MDGRRLAGLQSTQKGLRSASPAATQPGKAPRFPETMLQEHLQVLLLPPQWLYYPSFRNTDLSLGPTCPCS